MALALLRGGPAAALPAGGWSRLRPRAWSSGPGPFQPQRVVVVAKTTRFEFEQQRSGAAGGGEREAALRQRLATKGSSYCGLLERHHSHSVNVQHVLDSLRKEGIEVRLVKRRDYTEETVRWADAIVSAGGDGTMLLTASKVFGRLKPVIGVNTDPERSQGHLCLPLRYTRCFSDALRKLRQGEFRWQWRQRIRIRLEGVGFNATPVDLHEQQLSLEQHTTAHRKATNTGAGSGGCNGPKLLPVRALNEVFVGESLSSRPSYYEISIDGGPWEKHKNSGLNVCTGTGSRAWYWGNVPWGVLGGSVGCQCPGWEGVPQSVPWLRANAANTPGTVQRVSGNRGTQCHSRALLWDARDDQMCCILLSPCPFLTALEKWC